MLLPPGLLVPALAFLLPLLAFLAGLFVLRLTHPLPRGPFERSETLPAPDGPIAAAFAPRLAAHPDLAALHIMRDPHEALAARLEMAEAAVSSLDLQYYNWCDDGAGALMMGALRSAAARGVRVRLLIDDSGSEGLDRSLMELDALPNVEVRLFNAFPIRHARLFAYMADFRRLNRRMHNKALLADSTVAILGGRNIGDAYFNALAPQGTFMDMDVAVAGPVVAEVAAQFDLYWNSPQVTPAARMLPPVPPDEIAPLRAAQAARLSMPAARTYGETVLRAKSFLLDPATAFTHAPARLIYDRPEKVTGLLGARKHLWNHLIRALGRPTEELVIISPYFVPTRIGVRILTRFIRAGVRLKVLTNSLVSTDVPLVHSGYAHRRRPLLRRGALLYEMAPDAAPVRRARSFLGRRLGAAHPFKRNKLHAKIFVVDRKRVFIGSFNFDPRSMRLNTELGLIIEHPGLAASISDSFDDYVPKRAWKVSIGRDLRLCWTRAGGETTRREPGTTFGARVMLAVAQRLPIEWLL